MYKKLSALFLTVVALATASQAQSGGANMVLLDGSVKNILQIEAGFPLQTDPGHPRVHIARLPARSLEACMGSTDFSSARPMDMRMYQVAYSQATGTARISFGVEREMKESPDPPIAATEVSNCHVVRFAGSAGEGRDFLIWQKDGASSSSLNERIAGILGANVQMQDGSVRFVKDSVSIGF